MTSVGVGLIYMPAGLIFGGLVTTGLPVAWTLNSRRRPS